MRWWPDEIIATLPLHHGLRGAWSRLAVRPPSVLVVIDRAGVDDLAVATMLSETAVRLARLGFTADRASFDDRAADADDRRLRTVLPDVRLVTAASPALRDPIDANGAPWWRAKLSSSSAAEALDEDGHRSDRRVIVVSEHREQWSGRAAMVVDLAWLTGALGG